MNIGGDSRKIVLIGGPTGGGKTSIAKAMKDYARVSRVITTTTRQPRCEEKAGVDYFFVSVTKFRCMQEIGKFVESDEDYTKDMYGTTWEALKTAQTENRVPMALLTEPGIKAFKKIFSDALTIFIAPEQFSDLDKRIGDRDQKERRLEKAREEMDWALKHYQVILSAPNGGVPILVKHASVLIRGYVEE